MQSRRKVVLDRAAVRCGEISSADESPRQGAKASFDGRNVCQKCFCVTFDESNKAFVYAPKYKKFCRFNSTAFYSALLQDTIQQANLQQLQ